MYMYICVYTDTHVNRYICLVTMRNTVGICLRIAPNTLDRIRAWTQVMRGTKPFKGSLGTTIGLI